MMCTNVRLSRYTSGLYEVSMRKLCHLCALQLGANLGQPVLETRMMSDDRRPSNVWVMTGVPVTSKSGDEPATHCSLMHFVGDILFLTYSMVLYVEEDTRYILFKVNGILTIYIYYIEGKMTDAILYRNILYERNVSMLEEFNKYVPVGFSLMIKIRRIWFDSSCFIDPVSKFIETQLNCIIWI